jgi:phosphohistidine phosphatase
MRTLYLLRHAKSSWDDPGLADHDRQLAARGIRAAASIAAHMRTAGIRPDLVLCSSARRTRQTLDLLGEAVPSGSAVRIEDGLYGAAATELLDVFRRLPPDPRRVLLIGHNPGVQDLALLLVATGEHRAQAAEKYPTGALATLETDAEWADLRPGCARLADFVRPRDLDAGGGHRGRR